jgi:hypothetical protein
MSFGRSRGLRGLSRPAWGAVMAREPFWNSSRIEDLWIAIALAVASGLLFWVTRRRSNAVLDALAAFALAASLFVFFCVRCAP